MDYDDEYVAQLVDEALLNAERVPLHNLTSGIYLHTLCDTLYTVDVVRIEDYGLGRSVAKYVYDITGVPTEVKVKI